MMTELIAAVTALVGEETQRAKENHGEKYASLHEGYGVLAEEVQEAEEAVWDIWETDMAFMLQMIHMGQNKLLCDTLEGIAKEAINAACECIQVAAVARKMMEGM